MATDSNLVIDVPTIARTRESSADADIVLGMASQVSTDKWVTDGQQYAKYGDAANASQVYRRALATAMGQKPHQIKSRVWGTKGTGKNQVIVTDRNETAKWVFALTHAPEREKRERVRSSNGATAAE